MSKPITLVRSEERLKSFYFHVATDVLKLPNGNQVTREIVYHPGAVVVVPRTAQGNILMIRQYRHAIRETILEFPAGTLEKGEDPLVCAKREIMEEVGHSAAKWAPMGILYPAPGFCSEVQHCYFAEDLTPARLEQDEDEIIDVVEISPAEIDAAITSGAMNDGKSIAVYSRARLLGLV